LYHADRFTSRLPVLELNMRSGRIRIRTYLF
jgi:hypothetical protein